MCVVHKQYFVKALRAPIVAQSHNCLVPGGVCKGAHAEWTLKLHCGLVSSHVSCCCSGLDSLEGPWTWYITVCHVWGCGWTLLPAPSPPAVCRHSGAVPWSVRECLVLGHSQLLAYTFPWSFSLSL